MTDEKLNEIREALGRPVVVMSDDSRMAIDTIDRLGEMAHALLAEVVALREIARAVAEVHEGNFGIVHDAVLCYNDNAGEYECPWCHGRTMVVQLPRHRETFEHESDCPVTKARKLLGMEP